MPSDRGLIDSASMAGKPFRCPNCRKVLGQFGVQWAVEVRAHPGGRGAPPTSPAGFSVTCKDCKTHVDVGLLPLPLPEAA
jgi:hypothetical protein